MGPRWARWDQHWTGWSAIGPGPNPTTVNVSTPLHVDGRGLGASCDTTGDPTKNPNVFIDELEQGYHFRQPPWSLAFPEIKYEQCMNCWTSRIVIAT